MDEASLLGEEIKLEDGMIDDSRSAVEVTVKPDCVYINAASPVLGNFQSIKLSRKQAAQLRDELVSLLVKP